MCLLRGFGLVVLSLLITQSIFAADTSQQLFLKHCAQCHGMDRLGGMGPALIPENLKRLSKKSAIAVIKNGRPATQMPAHAKMLTVQQVGMLADRSEERRVGKECRL